MSDPAPLYVVGCAAENVQQDGTCSVPVWMPYHQPILPPLDLADGALVAGAIVLSWAIGLKARLVFRAARIGVY
ncbi:TPA: hypothetical protein ACOEBN_000367 [Stenotrophomonas maltophilia]|uniref:hypothetical protein n=1 Tax=Stenotrophomonas TaxID=40323 RepID=UPI001CA7618D|nr:hypothetical protein [Stenotrophomonas maltophilia]EKT4067073.1 hypothetical protein [Stenotrophomonas maltophilia]MBY8923591.1 hypothetical protein [Stenotrophomonas maltophilia]MCO7478373.1 hypothetical protein [Stenotrophomonas maltophilia]MCO7478385.1 hypothetical protein [Stenotrophomonas maltophilia]UVH75169.1 hypothetical protein NW343_11090 [Stenotrophomonas maltophilia]